MSVIFYGGERGIRTLDELPHTAFRERPVQPLLHLSSSERTSLGQFSS